MTVALTYREAKARLEAHLHTVNVAGVDDDLNNLRAELAVLLDAVNNNHFPRDPGDNHCPGFVLWQHEDDPKKRVTIRNGVINCIDGAHHSLMAERLWLQQTSEIVPRTEYAFGRTFDRGKPFHYSDVLAGLEEIIGCKKTGGVNYGFDGFYHFTFERQFKARDRQRLKVENILTFMQDYDCSYGGSYVVLSTANIEVVCRLMKDEPGREKDA